ncbi:hypothetical protein AVEN_49580-1 [Araneus ventricosus]|uniref:Endonuclease/exonuclease/phosphatase domain-containing protein n=1 Tax=Araneus ventricosus TaxID=182803 RepID=A0A4Y2J1Y1_ARAVE|nr:hypothetical protein AVEN_49580-1 [Araneus ventricosus]
MGRSLTLPLCLLVLAGNNGVTFTPWVALPGEITPDVHHPLLPGTPPCHDEATNRTKPTLDRKANYSKYYSYRKSQNQFQQSGGAAIAIKNNIPHCHLIPPTLNYVDATVVVLNYKNFELINLISMYIPPSDHNMCTFHIESLIQLGPYQIICEDFNAHHVSWNCNRNSPREITLRSSSPSRLPH